MDNNKTFPTEELLAKLKLFWQYPVITERTFYEQNKSNVDFFGFPWATIIDKRYNLQVIYNLLKPYIDVNKQYYTCCQHISFRNLIGLFEALHIHIVYSPHKIKNEDAINGVYIKPCPLYAVNYEDAERNSDFMNKDFIKLQRNLLYSFQGAYDKRWYMSNIREQIFNMKHPDNSFVYHIGGWHFDNVVYSTLQNNQYMLNENDTMKENTSKYNKLLLDSRYSLCPSGSGPNSIRFWEALACGSIPVLLSDKLELPYHDLLKDSIIIIEEKEIRNLRSILENISQSQEENMRQNCLHIYEYFKNNFKNTIKNTYDVHKKTLFTSYCCNIDDEYVQFIIYKWKKLNPDYNVLYFSDDDVRTFFENTQYNDTYKKMKNGVAIADFFRICYINKHGGYWFDIDIEPVQLKINANIDVHLFDCGYKNISYMFIGGNKEQKIFDEVIDKVIRNIENNVIHKKQHILDITGPRVIQNIIYEKLNIVNKDGCLCGTKEPKQYLENTQYKFTYEMLSLVTTKTKLYERLQHKYKKKKYQLYNFI